MQVQQISRLSSASRSYMVGSEQINAVVKASLTIESGSTVGIIGPSGAGKSTLLRLMGMLDLPSGGEVFFSQTSVGDLAARARRRLRLQKTGFVFQQLKLLPTLSAIENVELPLALLGKSRTEQKSKAMKLLSDVGLEGKERRKPEKLSLGEQQRVAVARALINDPELILADEPTSQLDSTTGAKIIDILIELKKNSAVVIATHDRDLASTLNSVHEMRDGILS
jgi:ABC-type lipoprotein export system ATPase subunit